MEETTYGRKYPTGASSPKFYGLPKTHKKDVPLRPIKSSLCSVTYGLSKELERILKPLVGETINYINHTKEFADEIKNSKLEEGQCITSYDVSALFTSIPIASAIDM